MHLYNAAADSYSYAELGNRVDRFAGYLTGLGLPVESRILICLQDRSISRLPAWGRSRRALFLSWSIPC